MSKKKFLWNMINIMMFTILSFGFSSCSGDDEDDENSTSLNLTKDDLTNNGYFDGFLYYKITSNTPKEVTIAKAEKNARIIKIPNSINIEGKEYICTTIGENAFSGCKLLSSIEISPNIITIGNCAFANCDGLTSIDIPQSVISIDEYAFYGCTNLASINMSDNVACIGICAFYNCYNLKTITSNARLIGEKAFAGCKNLSSIHLKCKKTPQGFYSPDGFNYIVYNIDDKYYYSSGEDYSGETGQSHGFFTVAGHKFNFNAFNEFFNGVADDYVYSNTKLYMPKGYYGHSSIWGVFKNIIEE